MESVRGARLWQMRHASSLGSCELVAGDHGPNAAVLKLIVVDTMTAASKEAVVVAKDNPT